MPTMDISSLKAILDGERRQALSAHQAGKLSTERAKAMDYYQGEMNDLSAPEGTSTAMSSDVADTIDGLMPQLMQIFCGGDEVVRFEPQGREDVAAAEQETDYVNHVFMVQNPGFMVLYNFIKDALLQKVGIVKVRWEKKEEEVEECYYNQTDEQLMLLAQEVQDGGAEVVEHTAHPEVPEGEEVPAGMIQWHDLKIRRTKKTERAVAMSVPPEEFGISRFARDMRTTPYCFHEVHTTAGDLIAEGFDPDQIKRLAPLTVADNPEQLSRDTVDEQQGSAGDVGLNMVAREVKIIEHYILMDYEGNNKPRMYRVTTGGEPSEILLRKQDSGKYSEDVVPWDGPPPFATGCPVPQPHRFFGQAIADKIMEIQRIKTALIRGWLNNIYMQTNPRLEISESHAGVNTMDDALTVRPNGIIRTKQPGGLNWQKVPDVGGSLFPGLQYFDTEREWRTGLVRQGQGVDPNALQNQVATIANQMESQAQGRVEMIARILAETGIRDLFSLLHSTIRSHGSVPQTVRLRGTWVNVDPREWKSRNDMTINVGLGTGNKAHQLASLQLLMQMQKEAVQIGMVSKGKFYNSARELTRLVKPGGDTNAYFVDPMAPPDPNDPPLQPPDDPKSKMIEFKGQELQAKQGNLQMQSLLKQQEIQGRQALEGAQARADIIVNQVKMQGEAALERQRQMFEQWRGVMDQRLKIANSMTQARIGAMEANHSAMLDAVMANHKMRLDAFKAQNAAVKKNGQTPA